jgi:hypothetical protein
VEEIAPTTAIAVHRLSRNQGRKEDIVEVDATQDEATDDVFEEALLLSVVPLLPGTV